MADVVKSEGETTVPAPGVFARRPHLPTWTSPKGLTRRFALAYLVLAVIVGSAVGGLIVALGSKSSHSEAGGWSAWRPNGRGSLAVRQIANHVAPQYRLASGKQLVTVVAAAPEIKSTPISTIVIGSDLNRSGIKAFPLNNGIMFQLCGSANENCALPMNFGRLQLLRREALELSLYTFKYVNGVDSVLTLMPSPAGQESTYRLEFLRRGEVDEYLHKPLSATLAPRKRVSPGQLSKKEGQLVDRLTVARFFTVEDARQLQDGSLALFLTPPSL